MKPHAFLVPALFALAIPLASSAQSVAASSDQPADEETVYLSPFEVSSERVTGYRITDSASSRIRRALIDTPATINVISSDFVDDIGASSILDATQYVSGMSFPALGGPSGTEERQTVRGFDIFASTIDNFTSLGSSNAKIEPYIMERIEVYKGPNAILSPNGSPGGSTNLVTKSPKFQSPTHVAKLELADQHYGSRLSIDSTGRIPGTENFAYRIVGTHRDANSIIPGRLLNKTLTPMLTWAISEKTQIKLKGFFFNWGQKGATAGTPNDLRLSRTHKHGEVISADSIAPGYLIGEANGQADWQVRDNKIRRGTFEFLSAIGEHLNLRVAGMYHYSHTNNLGGGLRIWRLEGNHNPVTGELTYDRTWALLDPSLDYNASTNPYVDTVIPEFDTSRVPELYEDYTHNWAREFHYQADLAGKWDFGGSAAAPFATLNTVVGAARSRNWTHDWARGVAATPLPDYDFTQPFLPRPSRPTATGTGDDAIWRHNGHLRRTKSQAYGHAQIDTLGGRLLLSGGVSYQERNYRGNYNRLSGSVGSKAKGSKKDPSYAILYKVTSWASVYGSYSTNSDVQVANGSTGEVSLWSDGKQQEGGVKFEFFNRRLSITAAYYELEKTNVVTPHPMKWLDPDLPDDLGNITNDGIEFDVVGQITTDLTIMASYTDMKMRDEFGRRRANVPDVMYNALLRYKFSSTPVKGLNLFIGFTHADESAGENAPGGNNAYTALGALKHPSYYLPSRTTWNVGASYSFGSLGLQLNVDNLFNKEEFMNSGGRANIGWQPERNIRLTTTYNF